MTDLREDISLVNAFIGGYGTYEIWVAWERIASFAERKEYDD